MTQLGPRWLIYRPGRRNYLCVVAAWNSKAALETARKIFVCPRGTIALLERSEKNMEEMR